MSCDNENNCSNNNVPNMNMDVVKGALSIIFGLMFVVFAIKIILKVVFFVAGLLLLYYGLCILKLHQATSLIDGLVARIMSHLKCK